MLSKNQIKQITALHHKKFRRENNSFIVEGKKIVTDLLTSGWNVISLYGTQDFFSRIHSDIRISKSTEIVLVTDDELSKISGLTSPQSVLAVVEMSSVDLEINYEKGSKLVLDGISDPGNLGTLIRIADWFGIDEIICSDDCTECFNPKVVQASMGSIFRKKIIYDNLPVVLSKNLTLNKLPVYGTMLEAKSLYEENLREDSFIVAGNESTGIREELLNFITHPVTIPGSKKSSSDSLNVAIAMGIVCAELRRKNPN